MGSGYVLGISITPQSEQVGRAELDMSKLDAELICTILQEINACLSQGVLPVHNDHLKHLLEEGNILDYLLFMKDKRLISGNLISKGVNNIPYRITNIRLTYLGIRALQTLQTPG